MNLIDIIQAYKDYNTDKYNRLLDYLTIIIPNFIHNPYHNLEHTINVFQNVWCLTKHKYESQNKLFDTNTLVNNCYLTLVAALFHDFNHTGGKENDYKNIQLATEYFKKVTQETELDTQKIIDIINMTKFPYNDKRNEFNEIIRGADLGGFYTQSPFLTFNLIFETNQTLDSFINSQESFKNGLLTKYINSEQEVALNNINPMKNSNFMFLLEVINYL